MLSVLGLAASFWARLKLLTIVGQAGYSPASYKSCNEISEMKRNETKRNGTKLIFKSAVCVPLDLTQRLRVLAAYVERFEAPSKASVRKIVRDRRFGVLAQLV